MSHGNGRIRCQEEKLQIIAKVEMNERNSDQVNILANFSKSNGQFIDTQLLTMRNTPSLNFETTMNGNGKGLFYKIIEIQDEFEPTIFEYEILFSGANY
jgi:hypothetical protein